MKTVSVAFLGLGNIGSGVFALLARNGPGISHREGVSFQVKRVLVRSLEKQRAVSAPPGVLTTDFESILNDPEITLVAEFMGGIEPACGYIERLLRVGKSVVSANKEVIAARWPALEEAARAGNAGLYFEASVCGGIPVIRTLYDSLQANEISQIKGIINGTTNYMLCRMSEMGIDYREALREAQELGYAEPDPTNDVEGQDAACKLSILASIAFHSKVPLADVYREGISGISPLDISIGRELGFDIKLLAIGKKHEDSIEARVAPTFIPLAHPLSSVRSSYNAVFLEGDAVGNLMLYGRGAGDMPTASAIVSDMILAAGRSAHRYNTFRNTETAPAEKPVATDWVSRYFMRVQALDKPGVLAKVAGVLARHNVSISTCIQKGCDEEVPVVFVTHATGEKAMKAAVSEIRQLSEINAVAALIRVED